MRFLAALALTVLLSWLLGLWLPFWSLSLAALVVGFITRPSGRWAFMAGLLAGALLWGGLAWWADAANGQILSTRVGAIFSTDGGTMVLITALVGGILGGLGVLVGDRIRHAVS
jgi:hypothetical protein